MADKPPIVIRGFLGWGNRKNGCEAYGPGGRWGNGREGHLLGDALEEAGASEGADLIVVAIPRFSGGNEATMKARTARFHAAIAREWDAIVADDQEATSDHS